MTEPSESGIERKFSSQGLRLNVVDHGGTGSPVILLHGGSAHARWWDFVVPHLGADRRALALDFRGHGDSEWAAAGAYAISDYAADVRALIEAFDLQRPVLVGHSLGSFVALRYAVDHPADLSALVLVDGRATFGAAGSRYLRLLGMFSAAAYETPEEVVESFRPLPRETIAAPEVLAHVARHGVREVNGRWTTKFDRASLAGHQAFDLRDRLADLDLPVLLVRGEQSTVVSAASARKLVAACRRGRLVEVAGCHHHVLIDRPDLLGQEIRAFLAPLTQRAK